MKKVQLIAVKLTPVQDFIQEARKAQDIYCGSYLLSTMAREIVERLSTFATIIYPDKSGKSVTNEILALCDEDRDLQSDIQRACRAGLEYFQRIADCVKARLLGKKILGASPTQGQHLWDNEIQAQFQTFWAIMPVDDIDDKLSFAQQILNVKALVGAARNAYMIKSYVGTAAKKCTLCAQWESIELTGRESLVEKMVLHEREYLCAVCLVRRCAPRWRLLDPDIERFPSTGSIAWANHKSKMVQLIYKSSDMLDYIEDMRAFIEAIKDFAKQVREFPGNHILPFHDRLLQTWEENYTKNTPPCLHYGSQQRKAIVQEFLQLDGQWLDNPQNLKDTFPNLQNIEVLRKVENSHERLQKRFGRSLLPSCSPQLAISFADIDELGKKQFAIMQREGWERGNKLSLAIAQFITQIDTIIQSEYPGRTIFGGGDEILALVPAECAMEVAARTSRCFQEVMQENGFPDLTISVSLVIVPAHRPLRKAIQEVHSLMEKTKNYRRYVWDQNGNNKLLSRSALGISVIPGSGNIKQGIIGMEIPHYDDQGKCSGTLNTCEDVILPMLELCSWQENGIHISPALFYEINAEFSNAIDAGNAGQDSYLPDQFMDITNGIFLAECRRLANRHVEIEVKSNADIAAIWQSLQANKWTQKFIDDKTTSCPCSGDSKEDTKILKSYLVDGLIRKIRSLAFAGNANTEYRTLKTTPWNYFSGWMAAIRTLTKGEGEVQ